MNQVREKRQRCDMTNIANFLDYLRAELNRSERTVENYAVALREFEAFFHSLAEGITWESADTDIVREWVVYMIDEEDKKPATVSLALSALRTFYRYLMKTGKTDRNPAANVKSPKKAKRLPAFVKEESMSQLLDNCKFSDDFEGTRNRLIILMLYLTGMRRAEILGLQDKDILWQEKAVKVTGKRMKQRIIPVSDELLMEVRRYIDKRTAQFSEGFEGTVLLLGKKGKNLRPDEIHRIVTENLSMVTTQQRRSSHVLRHTFATAMLNHGADLQSIQQLMGHESLETTQIYTHLSFEELKNAYNKAHPRS